MFLNSIAGDNEGHDRHAILEIVCWWTVVVCVWWDLGDGCLSTIDMITYTLVVRHN